MQIPDQKPEPMAATSAQQDTAVELITGEAPRRVTGKRDNRDLTLLRLEHEQARAPSEADLTLPQGLPSEG